ncbi:MAG: tetratricopeptide repeat protein, partial [Acidobacteria bacterium]|nr:tetratricopeptide repeat protein [Acidobacteriota bacterium]
MLAPLTPIIEVQAATRAVVQDGDIPSDAEQAMFTKGQNLYNQGRFDQAATVLKDFLKTYPSSIITDLTLLWLGRSYMQLGKLDDAEQVGQRLRAIKDTPFADIYESELLSARRDAPARAPAMTVAAASPTPTPARTTPTPRSTPQSSTARTITPPTVNPRTNTQPVNTARNNTPTITPPQARRIADNPPAQVASNETTRATTPRNNARSRRRKGQQPAAQPDNTASTGTPARTLMTPVVTPTPTPTPRTQVATNTPPRTGTTTRTTTERPATTMAPSTMTSVITPTVRPTQPPPSNTESTVAENTSPQSGPGLNLTVRQVPNLVLALRNATESASPGQTVQLPLTVTNTGNKEDQFRLETDLPAEFQPSFSLTQSGSDTGLPILVTPQIARGAAVEVMLNLRVPETATDGQQRRFFVRAASQSDYQVRQVADGAISIVAAALSAVSNVSSASVLPGDTFTQTITVRNAGSASARNARADFVFDPNFELVNATPSPIAYD